MSRYAVYGLADAASRDDASPVFNVGDKFYDAANDRVIQYVLFDNGAGNVAAVAGNLAYWLTRNATTYTVTMDVSDSDRNLVCGVFLNVITDGQYGFIQIAGRYATVKTNADDDITKGDAVIASAAGDGTADSTAQDTAPICRVVGWALADDVNAADTVDTLIVLD